MHCAVAERGSARLLVPIAAAAAFSIYVFTLAPSIYPGDSPEFTAAAHVLGIPHPPGYPHYVLIGKLFAWLPVGNIAFRLNLLSAASAALAAAVFASIAFRVSGEWIPALTGSLLFAVSRDTWAQAGSAEVYTFHLLIVLTLLLLASSSEAGRHGKGTPADRRNASLVCASAFVAGFGTGIHYFTLFALPGVAFLLWSRIGGEAFRRSAFAAAAAAVAGWCFFLIMPLRASAAPALNWGETSDPLNFLTHIFWSQYAQRPSVGFSAAATAARFADFVALVATQWPWPVFLLVPPGILRLWRTRRDGLSGAIALLFLVPAAATVLLLNDPSREIMNGIDSNKFLCAYGMCGFVITMGICEAWRRVAGFAKAAGRSGPSRLLVPGTVLPMVLLVAVTAARNRAAADRSAAVQLHAYVLNLVDPLPADAGLVTTYDVPTFPLLYLQFVEEYRPDLSIYGREGILFRNDYNAVYSAADGPARERARRKIDAEIAARHAGRAFFSNLCDSLAPGGDDPGIPFGLVYAPPYAPPAGLPDLWSRGFIRSPFSRDALPGLDHRSRELVSDMYRMSAERALAGRDAAAAEALLERSVSAAPNYYWAQFHAGILRHRALRDHAGAETLLARAGAIIPTSDVFRMIGIARFESGNVPGALRAFRDALALDPRDVASLLNAAQCEVALDNLAAAEELLVTASRTDPGDPRVWLLLGRTQGASSRFDDAVRSLTQAVLLSPRDADAYFLRGIAELGRGEKDKAREDILRALAIHPHRKEFREALSRIAAP